MAPSASPAVICAPMPSCCSAASKLRLKASISSSKDTVSLSFRSFSTIRPMAGSGSIRPPFLHVSFIRFATFSASALGSFKGSSIGCVATPMIGAGRSIVTRIAGSVGRLNTFSGGRA